MNKMSKTKLTTSILVAVVFFSFFSAFVFAGKYGCPWNGNRLTNYRIGIFSGSECSFRFKAKYTGYADKILWYNITGSGYSGGTGGTIDCELQTNNPSTNLPSGTVLATATLTNPLAGAFQELYFDSNPYLSAGTLYHLVFKNIDSNPATNYTSVDALYTTPAYTPNQPGISDLDLGLYWRTSPTGTWQRKNSSTPIYKLTYTNGNKQGQGYNESWIGTPKVVKLTTSLDYRVRQTIKPSNTVTVKVVWARLKKVGNPERIRAEITDSSGTVITRGDRLWTGDGTYQWIKWGFHITPVTLSANTQYYLVFRGIYTAGDSDYYEFFPLKEGAYNGFNVDNLFTDGKAEYSTDGGSTWNRWRSYSTAADLQFYFETQ